MPNFKRLPEAKQGNEALRMHCALVHAQMKLSMVFHALKLKPGDDFPPSYVINLFGTVEETSDLAYLWTALLIMGQKSGRKGFSIKNIEVINSEEGPKKDKRFFDPKSQYSTKFWSSEFSSFKDNSVYETVLKPLMALQEIDYCQDERFQPFEHQLRDKQLKEQVRDHMISYFLDIYFVPMEGLLWMQLKTSGRGIVTAIHQMGYEKFGMLVAYLNRQFTTLSLRDMKMSDFGVRGVSLILSCCEGIREVMLDNNGLNRLDPDPASKENHILLCTALSMIPKSVTRLTLRDNGLSTFNKTELMEIMQAIPSTVKVVVLTQNKLDSELEKELLSSRGQTMPSQKPTPSVISPQPILGKTNEEKPVKVTTVSQTHFAKPSASPSSSDKPPSYEEAMSFAPGNGQ
ncbi:hypothetical protein ACD661_00585 [Legionella lytica]|uniref:Leucine-rich repeat-containing protein n=1 Tax=Legionella lytica TaxID=96232 RepID=A0ABW8D515_9GAMM